MAGSRAGKRTSSSVRAERLKRRPAGRVSIPAGAALPDGDLTARFAHAETLGLRTKKELDSLKEAVLALTQNTGAAFETLGKQLEERFSKVEAGHTEDKPAKSKPAK